MRAARFAAREAIGMLRRLLADFALWRAQRLLRRAQWWAEHAATLRMPSMKHLPF